MNAANLRALRGAIAPVLAAAVTAANAATTLGGYDLPARVRGRLEDTDRMLARVIAELEGTEP